MTNHERQAEAAAATAAEATTAAVAASGETVPASRPDQQPAIEGTSECAPSGSSAERSGELTPIEDFKIRCLSSALYHEDRERFFAWVHKAAMFLVVASGTAALSPLRDSWPVGIPILTTLVGLLDLVFDLSGKARLHASLRKQTYILLSEADVAEPKDLDRRLTLIYADEPPCMYAVNAISYNRAMESYGRPRKHLLDVGWRARLVRHIVPFTASTFRSFDEAPTTAS